MSSPLVALLMGSSSDWDTLRPAAELLAGRLHGLADPGQVVGALGDDGPGAGVGQDPADLLGRRRLVDRHPDGSREPRRVVQQGPLVARLRQQRDAVPDLDARSDESLGDRADQAVVAGQQGHDVPRLALAFNPTLVVLFRHGSEAHLLVELVGGEQHVFEDR